MERGRYHIPVMAAEVESFLVNDVNGTYVDCTLGGGGHSYRLLEKYPGIKILGVDCDEAAIEEATKVLSPFNDRVKIVRENYAALKDLLGDQKLGKVNGILLDLGVSSKQLDDATRGFSFKSESLDMRMDTRLGQDAKFLVNNLEKEELEEIFFTLGEERFSGRISRAIIEARKRKPIATARELGEVVARAKGRYSKVHPATKVFMALRLRINSELQNLSCLLGAAGELLSAGGRIVVLSYHSLEDRIVKNNFKLMAAEGVYKVLTKKVVFPTREESFSNPRSRSAKLRAAERI
jgi:16S rRNA (cytosine1402-N4)-methyltransferase